MYVYIYTNEKWLKKGDERLVFRENETIRERKKKLTYGGTNDHKERSSLFLLVCFQRNNIVNLFRTMFAHKVENDSVKHLLHFFQTYLPFHVFPYSPVEFQRASNGAIQPLRNSPPIAAPLFAIFASTMNIRKLSKWDAIRMQMKRKVKRTHIIECHAMKLGVHIYQPLALCPPF